jgi:hypothetical protein
VQQRTSILLLSLFAMQHAMLNAGYAPFADYCNSGSEEDKTRLLHGLYSAGQMDDIPAFAGEFITQ